MCRTACWATCCLGGGRCRRCGPTVVKRQQRQKASSSSTAATLATNPARVVVQAVCICHRLRPRSASASPSGVGRARLKRCLTFWTACSSSKRPRAAPFSRAGAAAHPGQPMAAPRRRRPVPFITASGTIGTTRLAQWAPLRAGGGPASSCLGRPSAVSNSQGMLHVTVYPLLNAYCFITTRMWLLEKRELPGGPSTPLLVTVVCSMCLALLSASAS